MSVDSCAVKGKLESTSSVQGCDGVEDVVLKLPRVAVRRSLVFSRRSGESPNAMKRWSLMRALEKQESVKLLSWSLLRNNVRMNKEQRDHPQVPCSGCFGALILDGIA
jgi:hypothetical protein